MKDNNPPEQPSTPPQTIKCFVVPVEGMEGIIDALKESPYKVANGALQYIKTLQIMDVPVAPPNPPPQ